MSELPACPFCGGRNIAESRGERGTMCRSCGSEAFGNWNTRPLEDALRAEIAQLQEELNVYHQAEIEARYQAELDARYYSLPREE